MLFQKVLKPLSILGLVLVLLLMGKLKIAGMTMISRSVILLSKYRALMPYIVAQAKHESNNFRSNVYLKNHNMFGMKFIDGRRGQIATKGLLSPEGDHYAHFANDSAGIIDLLKLFDAKKFPLSVKDGSEYSSELKKRGYYGASLESYTSRLNYWLKA